MLLNYKPIRFNLLLIASLSILLFSCNSQRLIKPLDEGETRVSADVGGPLIQGLPFPMPLSSVSVAHGLKEQTSLFGGLQVTSLGYQALQFDLGANIGLLRPDKWKPGLSSNLLLNNFFALRSGSFDVFPETSLNAYWSLSEKHFPYFNLSLWYDLAPGSADFEKGRLLHPTLSLGYNYEGKRWVLGLEGKWLNMNKEIRAATAFPQRIAGSGASGIYLKFSYRINVSSNEE